MSQSKQSTLIRTCFPDRKSCLEHCRETYIAIAQHDLVLGKSGNDRHFSLVCRDCRVVVLEAKLSSKEDFFVIEDFGIKPGHKFPGNSDSWCEPNNRRRASIAAMSQNQALQILVNEDSALGKRKTTSTKVKGLVLALEGFGGASESSIKKAVEKIKLSPMDHLSSYSLLHPYFEKWKLQDPSLRYDIEPKTDGVFHRLLVLMPNTVAFLPNLLNVFALDAGHMVEMRFKGIVLFHV